mgnify:CR=1 FL=1
MPRKREPRRCSNGKQPMFFSDGWMLAKGDVGIKLLCPSCFKNEWGKKPNILYVSV